MSHSHSSLQSFAKQSSSQLRVALLGRGTVGGGVYERLRDNPLFKLVGCAVRSVARHPHVPDHLISTDAHAVVDRSPDVVVEVIGGTEIAHELVLTALERGCHVVTANKALIAKHGAQLNGLAREVGCQLRYSAAIGGGVPVLETIDRLRATQSIVSVRGVLSGTANYILDALGSGTDFDEALKAAQALGLAEADPSRDLDGTDAAEKIAIAAAHAFGHIVELESIERIGIEEIAVGQPSWTLVATATRERLSVRPVVLEPGDPLAGLRGAQNRVLIETEDGHKHVVSGVGAGRWPTTTSVMADLNAINGRAFEVLS